MVKYSFIIPVKYVNDYIRESISKILEIQRDDFEIIIYPDDITNEVWDKTRQISTGHIGPAEKRDCALRDAKGEILIFIDDDAFPESNMLDVLDNDFFDEKIGAVGGPAITPATDSFWQRVSGAVFLSRWSGGYPERYARIGAKRYIEDWPSVNFSIRKSLFEKLGGFNSKYWPGEDTKLCLDILSKTDYKIVYDPDVVVWHHRREGFFRHLKQVGNYGLHRGFFAKKYPQTSLRFKYFLPSIFFVFVVFGCIFAFFSHFVIQWYIIGWLCYGLVLSKVFYDIRRYEKSNRVALAALYYTFFTHLFYGLRFIQGLFFTYNLKSKLR